MKISRIAMTGYLDASGLSTVAQEYFKCLTGGGLSVVPVWLMPPSDDVVRFVDPDLANEMMEASKSGCGEEPLQFHTGLADSTAVLRDKSGFIGTVVVEGNSLTPKQAAVCNAMDHILVPSRFCYNACLSSGVPRRKLSIAPYPTDPTWNPEVVPNRPGSGRFRFLFMNTFYERKGWDSLLRAWWDGFSADDPVELVIKSYRENDRAVPVEARIVAAAAMAGIDRTSKAPIRVLDEVMHSEDLPGFMKSFDAYVSPHRSEGFGLNILHAMALGVPVVCTDYGGCTDFATSETAWLVGKERGLRAPSAGELAIFPHLKGLSWAEPDHSSLVRQMRDCIGNAAERQARADRGAAFVADRYSQASAFEAFKGAIQKWDRKVWVSLNGAKAIEDTVRQAAPRFEHHSKPIRFVEA